MLLASVAMLATLILGVAPRWCVAGWIGFVPDWVLVRMIPRGVDWSSPNVMGSISASERAAVGEFDRRYAIGELEGADVIEAIKRAGLIRFRPTWPKDHPLLVQVSTIWPMKSAGLIFLTPRGGNAQVYYEFIDDIGFAGFSYPDVGPFGFTPRSAHIEQPSDLTPTSVFDVDLSGTSLGKIDLSVRFVDSVEDVIARVQPEPGASERLSLVMSEPSPQWRRFECFLRYKQAASETGPSLGFAVKAELCYGGVVQAATWAVMGKYKHLDVGEVMDCTLTFPVDADLDAAFWQEGTIRITPEPSMLLQSFEIDRFLAIEGEWKVSELIEHSLKSR